MAIRPIPSSREEWLKLRKDYVGASETAALLGVQADYQLSPLALFLVKTGKIEAPDIEGERLEWGNDFEDAIARAACRREGWTLQPGVFATDDTISGSSATLDRVILPSEDDEAQGFIGPGALECKNVDFIAYQDKWIGDEPPAWILIQHQDQLACSGYLWGAVTASVAGNQYYCKRYMRHEPLIAAIRKAKTDFWQAVRDGRMPEADHFESTAIALRRLYPKVGREVLDLSNDNELPELFDEAKRLSEERLRLEKEEEAAKNKLRALIGANQKVLLAGGRVLTRSVGDDNPGRIAKPGEIIGARKGQDRLYLKTSKGKAA